MRKSPLRVLTNNKIVVTLRKIKQTVLRINSSAVREMSEMRRTCRFFFFFLSALLVRFQRPKTFSFSFIIRQQYDQKSESNESFIKVLLLANKFVNYSIPFLSVNRPYFWSSLSSSLPVFACPQQIS